MSNKMPPNKPVFCFHVGSFDVAGWANPVKQEGEHTAKLSATITKRFYDKTSKTFRETATLFPEDIPDLAVAVQETARRLCIKEKTSKDAAAVENEKVE